MARASKKTVARKKSAAKKKAVARKKTATKKKTAKRPTTRKPVNRHPAPPVDTAISDYQINAGAEACQYLDDFGAAEELNLSVFTLRNYRARGKGPKYTKLEGLVRYRRDWLHEYAESRVIDPSGTG